VVLGRASCFGGEHFIRAVLIDCLDEREYGIHDRRVPAPLQMCASLGGSAFHQCLCPRGEADLGSALGGRWVPHPPTAPAESRPEREIGQFRGRALRSRRSRRLARPTPAPELPALPREEDEPAVMFSAQQPMKSLKSGSTRCQLHPRSLTKCWSQRNWWMPSSSAISRVITCSTSVRLHAARSGLNAPGV
jgi:hypothetical protein